MKVTNMDIVVLYDTTLRDGTQGENINFTAGEKLEIAHRLDDLGIHYIEGGWPGSNPRDMRFFELAKRETFKTAKITAFGATRKPGIPPEKDENLQTLIEADTPVVTIFGKSWDLHVEKVMANTLEENREMISESVAYLRARGRQVIYDAEHFFDGYKDNPDYAMQTLFAAIEGGSDALVLCDTNGGTLPFEIRSIIKEVKQELTDRFPDLMGSARIGIGIHTHNDSGVAVANALEAVNQGARMVQGTINGYGERCGNADLTTIIPILSLKMGFSCISTRNLSHLKKLSRFVSETANIVPANGQPFVGKSAFAHKGGIHVSAVIKEPRAYEHFSPDLVGNKRRVLVSDLSGKSNIEYKAGEMGVALGTSGFNSREIVARVKDLEEQGYQFDVADGSFKILLEKLTKQFNPVFTLESFRVTMEKDKNQACSAHATVKISVNGKKEITAAEGDGPVSALDNALRKALGNFYPNLDHMHLVDFRVRVIDGREGTAARVRVFIQSRDQNEVWSTVGVSTDIIEASWQALEDSFQYKLSNKPDGH